MNLGLSELYCVRSSMEDALKKWSGLYDSSDEDGALGEIEGILEQVNAVIKDKEGFDAALSTLEKCPRND